MEQTPRAYWRQRRGSSLDKMGRELVGGCETHSEVSEGEASKRKSKAKRIDMGPTGDGQDAARQVAT